MVVAVAVSRSFLSKRKRFGPSLFREESPSLDKLCIPYSSFEEKVRPSSLSRGVTGASNTGCFTIKSSPRSNREQAPKAMNVRHGVR